MLTPSEIIQTVHDAASSLTEFGGDLDAYWRDLGLDPEGVALAATGAARRILSDFDIKLDAFDDDIQMRLDDFTHLLSACIAGGMNLGYYLRRVVVETEAEDEESV